MRKVDAPLVQPADARASKPLLAVLVVWTALLAALMWRSMHWRMVLDAPLLTYVAWAMHHGYRPYVDLFDMNLPGTYLLHYLAEGVLGGGDEGLRRLDLLWLVLTSLCAWRCVRPIDRYAAWVAALLVPSLYLYAGPLVSLQRDFMMLAPMFFAFSEVLHPRPGPVRSGLAGAALGFAMLIKPQAALLLPIFSAAIAFRSPGWRRWRGEGAAIGVGLALPLGVAFAWLQHIGALEAFLWSWRHYLGPYYSRLDGNGLEYPDGMGLYLESARRALHSVAGLRRGIAAAIGGGCTLMVLFVHPWTRQDRIRVWTLVAMVAYGVVHVVLAVKHWAYHGWPAVGAACLLLGAATAALERISTGWRRPVFTLLPFAVAFYAMHLVVKVLPGPVGAQAISDRLAVVDQLTDLLRANAAPGDRIQVLDTTGGGVQAAYQAGLLPGSRFIYDFHFFHHQQTAMSKTLRGMLLDDLQEIRPRFVVVWRTSWAHRRSFDDLQQFPELTRLLENDYQILSQSSEFRLYQRRGPS